MRRILPTKRGQELSSQCVRDQKAQLGHLAVATIRRQKEVKKMATNAGRCTKQTNQTWPGCARWENRLQMVITIHTVIYISSSNSRIRPLADRTQVTLLL